MNDFDRNDPVWKCLGHASRTKAGPSFARDVVRRVRLDRSGSEASALDRVLRRLFSPPAVSGALVAAVLVAGFFLFPRAEAPTSAPAATVTGSFDPAEELEEIAYFGELVAVNDPAELSDEALSDLFF